MPTSAMAVPAVRFMGPRVFLPETFLTDTELSIPLISLLEEPVSLVEIILQYLEDDVKDPYAIIKAEGLRWSESGADRLSKIKGFDWSVPAHVVWLIRTYLSPVNVVAFSDLLECQRTA